MSEWLRLLEPVANCEGFPDRPSVDTTSLAMSPVWAPVEPTGRRAGRALAVPAETNLRFFLKSEDELFKDYITGKTHDFA